MIEFLKAAMSGRIELPTVANIHVGKWTDEGTEVHRCFLDSCDESENQ